MKGSFLHSLLALTLCTSMHALAQNSVWDTPKDIKKNASKKLNNTTGKVKSYKEHLQKWGLSDDYGNELLIGGKLNSDGWSGNAYFLKNRKYNKATVWQLSFSEIKHEKQIKQEGEGYKKAPTTGKPLPYVFGKINNLYTLQAGMGQETLLLPAVLKGNLSVSFRYTFGLSLGLLKPYYLTLIYPEVINNKDSAYLEEHKYTLADSAKFLDPKFIYGGTKWPRGYKELDPVPGAFLETSFVIVPGKSNFFVQAITLGINGALYYKPLPIMADQPAYPWQVSMFAGLSLGKKWK